MARCPDLTLKFMLDQDIVFRSLSKYEILTTSGNNFIWDRTCSRSTPGGIWSSALSKIKGSVRYPGDRFKSDPYNSAAEPIWELVDGPHPEAVFHEYRMIPDYYWPEDDPSKAGEGANFIDNHVRSDLAPHTRAGDAGAIGSDKPIGGLEHGGFSAPPDFDNGSRSKLAGSTNADDEAAKGAAKSVNGLEHGGFSAPPDFDNGSRSNLAGSTNANDEAAKGAAKSVDGFEHGGFSAPHDSYNSFQSDVSGHTNADGGTAMGSDKSIDVDEHGGFSSPPHDEHVTNHHGAIAKPEARPNLSLALAVNILRRPIPSLVLLNIILGVLAKARG
ncbi:hypothetical protein KEM48_007235 [Puccinia striiformis f. sp. tritici PST-130]|nr:hypothetical protein KEM48_007235 [Puccinia striiformis f. sp. tritici PST-130]